MAILTKTLLLLATLLLARQTEGITRPTREFTFASNKAQTVAIDSHLVTVSYYDVKLMINSTEQRQVYLNLTSTDHLYKPCKIDLIPEVDTILYSIKATPIWRKIIVWGIRNTERSEGEVTTDYTFLLIDPRTCTYQALPNITDSSRLGTPGDPKVVVYQDRLDIFYYTQTVCSPCRFDLNGDKIGVNNQLKPVSAQPGDFHVRTVGKTDDYVVVYESSVRSTALILFYQSLSPKGYTIRLNSGIFKRGVAVNSVQNHPHIGVISVSKQQSTRQPIYTVFDHNLKIVFETYLPLLDHYNNDEVFANIDTAGNSYVTMIQREKRGPNWKITMVQYDANGRLVDEVVIGERIHLGLEVSYDEQAVLVDGREYCLVLHTRRGYKNPTENTNIKCFDVSGRNGISKISN